MSVGDLSASIFSSWLTKQSADAGELYYTTKTNNEVINILDWFNKHNQNNAQIKKLSSNSITIQAPVDDLRIFPLRKINDNPQFGKYIEAGTSHNLKRLEFEGILVHGPAGQAIRFYFDNF